MTSGLDLKLERVASRIKAVDLAREMGVSRQRVSSIEAVAVVPDETVSKYRSALVSLTSDQSPAASVA